VFEFKDGFEKMKKNMDKVKVSRKLNCLN